MKIALADRDRQSMLFIGGDLNFTYDNPGPIEVSLDSLTDEQKKQLVANYKQGIITVDQKQELLDSCDNFLVSTQAAIPAKTPVPRQEASRDLLEEVAEKRKTLKKLLNAHHQTVKKTTATSNFVDLKALLELEKEGKNRKSLVKFFSDLLSKHVDSVTDSVNQVELGNFPDDLVKEEMKKHSQFVTDIVESEEEEVTIVPRNEELEETDG